MPDFITEGSEGFIAKKKLLSRLWRSFGLWGQVSRDYAAVVKASSCLRLSVCNCGKDQRRCPTSNFSLRRRRNDSSLLQLFVELRMRRGRRNQSGIFPRGAKSHKRRVHPSTIHSTHAACSPPSRSIVHAALWNYPTRAASDPSPQDPGFLNHLDTWRPKIPRLLAGKTV